MSIAVLILLFSFSRLSNALFSRENKAEVSKVHYSSKAKGSTSEGFVLFLIPAQS
jgi:hypothetical protein